jgi:hypothetical protein
VKIDPKFKIMSNLLNPNVDHLQYLVVFWALSSILATWLCFDHLFKTSSFHLIYYLDVDFANMNYVYLDCCFYVNMNYGWYVYLSCITLIKWYQFSSLQNHLSLICTKTALNYNTKNLCCLNAKCFHPLAL